MGLWTIVDPCRSIEQTPLRDGIRCYFANIDSDQPIFSDTELDVEQTSQIYVKEIVFSSKR